MKKYRTKSKVISFSTILVMIVAVIMSIIGWLAHVIWGISMLMGGSVETGHIILAILGVVVPPIGVIHGIGWCLF